MYDCPMTQNGNGARHSEILAIQDAMAADLTPEQRARYEANLNPHADCPGAPYCGAYHIARGEMLGQRDENGFLAG